MSSIDSIKKFINFHRPIILGLSFLCYGTLIYSICVLSVGEWWKIFAAYYFIGSFEQIFHHRRFAHKSWVGPKWLDYTGLWVANQSLLGNSIVFSAQHRVHHKFSDSDLDPHSPLYVSWWKIQFLYPYHHVSLKYAYDLINDKMHIFYSRFGLLITFTTWCMISYFLSFTWLITIWLPGIALVILSKNYLNYKLHGSLRNLGNYRTYELNDQSNNNLIWGYLSFDGWHQNHHKTPNSWYLGRKWWEIDVPGMIIALLSIISFSFQNFKK